MVPKIQRPLTDRVKEAAEAALAAQHYVSPIDILVGIGWLAPVHVEEWRKGRLPFLEMLLQVPPQKRTQAIHPR